MTKTPQELFEIHYAEQTDRPIEQVTVHRWKERDGYDLPAMDRAYRYFYAGYAQGVSIHNEMISKVIAAQERDEILHVETTFGIDEVKVSTITLSEIHKLLKASYQVKPISLDEFRLLYPPAKITATDPAKQEGE